MLRGSGERVCGVVKWVDQFGGGVLHVDGKSVFVGRCVFYAGWCEGLMDRYM